jgi:protoheme IX farnesyltransferase
MKDHAHDMAGVRATDVAPPVSTLAAWGELLKLRITAFVALAAAVGGALGAPAAGADLARVLEGALWVTLAAGAAGVFNQVFERDTDALMRRTQHRPLPSGRISVRDAILFGTALAAVSTVALALRFSVTAALLSLASLFLYVAVYTPLKRVSSLNTVIGALPGAAPPLLGYAALAGTPGPWGWALFAVIFVWQFPHFMAIAWIYREDYTAGGHKMLPCLPGGEALAARQALLYSLAIVPVSIVPAVRGDAGIVFAVGATLLGLLYVAASLRFALSTHAASARFLVLTSLAYLPLYLSLVLLDPVVRVGLVHSIS